jgi:hypothetical protein
MKTSNKLIIGLFAAIFIMMTVIIITFKNAMISADNVQKEKTERVENE